MNSHISHERHTMFQSSADNVQNLLNVMISDMENNMNDKADEIFVQMQRDYRAVLGGAGLPQGGELLTRSQRLVRKEIMRIIDGVEGALLRVAGLETQEDEDKDGAGNERHKEPGDDDCVEERKGEDTAVPNDEKSEEINVKEEASPSSQLSDHAEQRIELNPAIQSSLDGEMKDAPQLESDQDQDFDPRPEVDEDSFEPSESSAGFESN